MFSVTLLKNIGIDKVSIEDYEADLEFNLVKVGDDWVIADNEEFLVAFLDFVF